MHTELTESDRRIVLAKSLSWLLLGSLVFCSAIAGVFYPIAVAILFAGGIGLLVSYFLKKKSFFHFSKELLAVSLLILLGVVAISLFATPTIFSGRDQGTISEAAIRLAQDNHFGFSTPASQTFFSLYGKGKALNFPGFYYNQDGSLVPQFPLAYISWLAFFYSLFGLMGITIANALLLYFFILSFYTLGRTYLSRNFSMLLLIFVFTSFCFGWFAKFTLSENMALALAWTMILALRALLKKPDALSYTVFSVSAILMVFTRIEGFALLLTSAFIIWTNGPARQYLKKNFFWMVIVPAGILLLLFAFNIRIDINFYREIAKALLNSLIGRESGIDLIEKANTIPSYYTTGILILYGMMGFLLLAGASVTRLLLRKNYSILLPFLVIFPTLAYLFDSHISLDQPWMLRRYLFTILPAAILYSTILLQAWWTTGEKTNQKRYLRPTAALVCAILVAYNINATARFFTYSENKQLLEKGNQFSSTFSSNDLVLLDRNVTGDGWAMLSGPMSFLWGKSAAYFFNIQDLDKIDYSRYAHVYLIIPDTDSQINTATITDHELVFYQPYRLPLERLDIVGATTSQSVRFPAKISKEITGKIYLVTK